MNVVLVIVLIIVGLGTLLLLAAIITGMAEKHRSGHLPGKGGGKAKAKPRNKKSKR